MTPPRSLHHHLSFESLRKKAKKLVRQFAAANPAALARVNAQLLAPDGSLTLREAQLVLAREYGFGGWQDLRAAVLSVAGEGLEWAVAEAERLIHDNKVDGLAQLLQQYPALLSWRGDFGESLLSFATGSFGDSGDPLREQMYTRIDCAEFLLDAGFAAEPAIWEAAMRARAQGVLQLLSRKRVPPRKLDILAALGDEAGVRDHLRRAKARRDPQTVAQAFLSACSFQHKSTAALLLDRCIELETALGERVQQWRGRSGFIDYFAAHYSTAHQRDSGNLWQTVVMNELKAAMQTNDLAEFSGWLRRESGLLSDSDLVALLETAAFKDRGPFIARLLELYPALSGKRPPSAALAYALEYGNAHLLPLLTQIWPLPHDLPHAAGAGDFARVKTWFDDAGHAKLGMLNRHHPVNHPEWLRNLHWTPPNAQHILDVAFAWSCLNRHFQIADFLLARGANINTDWSTHEPASILHECAVHANYQAAQFLIDRGIDMTIRDYRWNATAEGWAYHVGKDKNMAEFLSRAQRARAPKRPKSS